MRQVSGRLEILRSPTLRRAPLAEDAAGRATTALCDLIDAANTATNAMSELTLAAFDSHPDVEIYRSFPALGGILGARMLGEIGDDLDRFPSARHLCAYAGTAPVTRSSGLRQVTYRRMVCNRRLSRSTYNWTMPLVRLSPAAHALYYRRRAHGDRHSTASRNLTNHYLGILHHCLVTAEPYREEIAAAAYIKATENVSPVLVCGTPGTS